MLCEALFVIFRFLFYAGSHARKVVKKPAGSLRRPPGASRRLSGTTSRKNGFVSSFFMKVQHEIFFVMGEANFLTTSCETSSGKRRLNFEPDVYLDLYLERHSILREGSISLRGL